MLHLFLHFSLDIRFRIVLLILHRIKSISFDDSQVKLSGFARRYFFSTCSTLNLKINRYGSLVVVTARIVFL